MGVIFPWGISNHQPPPPPSISSHKSRTKQVINDTNKQKKQTKIHQQTDKKQTKKQRDTFVLPFYSILGSLTTPREIPRRLKPRGITISKQELCSRRKLRRT